MGYGMKFGRVSLLLFLACSCGAARAGVVLADLQSGGFVTAGTNTSVMLSINYLPDQGFNPTSATIEGNLSFGDGTSVDLTGNFNPKMIFSESFSHVYANPASPPQFDLLFANGTIDVLGTGSSQNDRVSFEATSANLVFAGAPASPVTGSVPEPSTWAMMLLGLVGLGFIGLRKTRCDVDGTTVIAA